jgi:hypothetical protein
MERALVPAWRGRVPAVHRTDGGHGASRLGGAVRHPAMVLLGSVHGNVGAQYLREPRGVRVGERPGDA